MNPILFVVSILSILAFSAAGHAEAYVCDGFAGVDEYRSQVDLGAGTADFFDNDVTSEMTLVETEFLQSFPPQTRYIFEGVDLGSSKGSTLKLYFTLERLSASLYSIDAAGKSAEIGSVICRKAN